MEHYNSQHKFFLETVTYVVDPKNAKTHELAPHKELVREVYFFSRQGSGNTFSKIHLDRKAILDLADYIKEVESKVTDLIVEPQMPF